VLVIAHHSSYAQTQKHDSLSLYKKIKKFCYKHKCTTWAYDAIFVNPEPKEYSASPTVNEGKIINPYLKYSGRIIRNVTIVVLDPFGHSVTDTTKQKINPLQKFGNAAHVTTRHWVINNKLLFKTNDTVSALSLSESERLLRQSVYVNDARIFITAIKNTDSVDVNVLVQDKWSITAPAALTDVSGNVRFRDQNLMGTGQQFEQYIGFRRPNVMDYNGYYNVANIDHLYLSSQLSYQTNKDGTGVGLSFDRPFYSPLAKWAGGASANKTWRYYNYIDPTDELGKQLALNNLSYDLWLGKSIKISDKKTLFNQSTNIIVGERYYASTYQKRPPFSIDVQRSNLNSSAFIGNIGFSVQQFYKDKFIYRFGANEDVPEGLIMQFLYGATKKEFSPLRYYTGIELARAKHFKFGYATATFSYGMFFNKYISNDITTNYKINYFSDLLRIGKWYIREFINYNLVYGQNKLPEEKISLTSDELYGFNSGSLKGNTKMVLNIETVAYAPYNLIGFRFAPVLLAGFGMLGDQQNNVMNSNLYQAYSLGLMVRNENLLSSTFQVSFGVYPFLPNGANNVVKYDPVTSFTIHVRTFTVSRPQFISY